MKHEAFVLYSEQYVSKFSLQNKVIDQAHTDNHLHPIYNQCKLKISHHKTNVLFADRHARFECTYFSMMNVLNIN